MQYETEEQQVEALKEWWNENGKAVIFGIILGAALVGAWMWWKAHQEAVAVAASDNFSQSMEALQAGEHDKVAELATAATNDHSGTLYATYTSLTAARSAVESGDLDAAAKHLQWAVDNSELDEVGVIARVRLARVKAAQGDASGALGVLPTTYAESFTPLVEEARGDVQLAAGDLAAAKAAYQLALDSERAPDAGALQMKINELATVGGSS